MKTAEEWKDFLSAIPSEDLPTFRSWQGSVEDLISQLAAQFVKFDAEVEEEMNSPEEEDQPTSREEYNDDWENQFNQPTSRKETLA